MSVCVCFVLVHACADAYYVCLLGGGICLAARVCMCVHVHYLELVIPTSNSMYSQIKMIMY